MMVVWLPIPGYEGRYEVSDQGQVRSIIRDQPLVMSAWPTQFGYLRVVLSKGHRRTRPHHVHKLVMLAFVGPRPDGMQIRHLDGTRTNNRLSNLVYGTQVENNLDALRHGRNRNANKTHCPQGHPYDELNTYLRSRNGYTHRQCRACVRESVRRYQQRRRGRAA